MLEIPVSFDSLGNLVFVPMLVPPERSQRKQTTEYTEYTEYTEKEVIKSSQETPCLETGRNGILPEAYVCELRFKREGGR